jgi:hypothetical protein
MGERPDIKFKKYAFTDVYLVSKVIPIQTRFTRLVNEM